MKSLRGRSFAEVSARPAPRVLIVAEHASQKFGGEAILPLHYFTRLNARGIDAWLLVHERTREELDEACPELRERIVYIDDTDAQRLLWRAGERLPRRIEQTTTGWLTRVLTQRQALRRARELVRRHRINVVHQPIPVSPKEPSLLAELGAPVVMGPMNGGMDYPPAFAAMEGRHVRWTVAAGRAASYAMNFAFSGKLHAKALLVANERTRRALPIGIRGDVIELVENGVDRALWTPADARRTEGGPLRAVFAGRLVDWKAVDVIVDAMASLAPEVDVVCDVLGDGPERANLENYVASRGMKDRFTFHGWMTQPRAAAHLRNSDVLLLPSLYECGGAVVLEAMASGLPVVATAWGGPADYVDASSGILIEPTSRSAMVAGFASAIRALAADPERRRAMGAAGRRRVEKHFDWEKKIDAIVEVYERAMGLPTRRRHVIGKKLRLAVTHGKRSKVAIRSAWSTAAIARTRPS